MKEMYRKFMKMSGLLNGKEYMLFLITYIIAPTLLKDKPATLITLSNKNMNMYNLWENFGEDYLKSITLKTYEIRKTNEVLILLFYDEKKLENILHSKNNMKFLSRFGYGRNMDLSQCLEHLKYRYSGPAYPHEIGIFLGIPRDDVCSFIENKGENYAACGYWKVYHNLNNALEKFYNYNSAKEKVLDLVFYGAPSKNVSSCGVDYYKQ